MAPGRRGVTVKLEHRVGVRAPASVVWSILSDIERWSEWNPLYTEASGKVGFGEKLTLTLSLPGRAPQVIRPQVFDWAPDEAIHWKLSALGGLLTTVRYLEIEPLSETGCVFSNGEIFPGLVGGLIARQMRRPIRAGFAALGERLREIAEAAWTPPDGSGDAAS